MPDPRDVHVDKILTNLSIAHQNPAFVAAQLFPTVPVAKQSDKYFVYGKESFNIPDTRYSKKAGFNRVDWTVSQDQYYAELRGLEAQLTQVEKDNADQPLNLEADTTMYLGDQFDLAKEQIIVNGVTDPAIITQNRDLVADGQAFDDPNSDPFEVIDDAKQAVEDEVIPEPNTLVLPKPVWRKLRRHPKVISKLSFTERGSPVSTNALAQLFEIDKILVPATQFNAAAEGQPPDIQRLWGKVALLAYVPPRAGLRVIGLGFTFNWWRRILGRYPEKKTLSEVFQLTQAEDYKLTAPEAAFLFENAIS
jgi:hypothetical protein